MRIREAREKAISDKVSRSTMSARDLWHAVYYVADSKTIRALADVLGVEGEAQKIRKKA